MDAKSTLTSTDMYLEDAIVEPEEKQDLLPITFALASKIQGQVNKRPMLVLLDSGSTTSWFSKNSLPTGVQGSTVKKVTGSTLAGNFSSDKPVCLENISFPDFHPKRKLPKVFVQVFNSKCRYDMIIGRNIWNTTQFQVQQHCL